MRIRQTQVGHRATRGFSLVELMIVVAIAGAVLSVGAYFVLRPNVANMIRRDVNETRSLFEELRGVARSSGRAVLVVVEESDLAWAGGGGGGRGTDIGRMSVFLSNDNTCQGGVTAGLLPYPPEPLVEFDHRPSGDSRGAALVRIEPSDSNGVATLCLTPSGRLLDAATAAPFASIGTGSAQDGFVFGGRVILEFAEAICSSATSCVTGGVSRAVEVGQGGTTDILPPGFLLSRLY
jgi:prepilin-type N-terminal cleavage/methylation domain-containing protein